LIEQVNAENPGFSERVLDSDGEIKRFVNIFVNGTDVRTLQGKATPVGDHDEVSIIPAMAGGTG
jgi:molybdopterin synthase sulfur carrier subunit